jgi:hypothetical protein
VHENSLNMGSVGVCVFFLAIFRHLANLFEFSFSQIFSVYIKAPKIEKNSKNFLTYFYTMFKQVAMT